MRRTSSATPVRRFWPVLGTVATLGVVVPLAASFPVPAARLQTPTAQRSGRLAFGEGMPFMITIDRTDGNNFNLVTGATCTFKQGTATTTWDFPVDPMLIPSRCKIHTQSSKRVTLIFMAKKAAPAANPVTGSITITIQDSMSPAVTTGPINVDEVGLSPCPPTP